GVLIVRPVQQLAEAARSLGAGHPGPRLKFAHPAREFGRLTAAFDEMASLLAAREQEQHEAAATLRASEQRFRHLLETSMVGFAVIRNSRVIYGNQALARMFGLPSATATIGVTYTDMVAPDDAGQVADRLREHEAGETSVSSYEVRYKRADGTTFAALTQSMRLDLPDGPATVAALIDLTEQKHAESERARLEMQLLQSQKMEAVGQLAGGVAHDFNNILTSISGYSELLLMDKSLPERARADLQEIHRAAVRASDLTRQLLAFSRKQVLTPRVLSLESAVRESQKMIQRLIGEDIELRYIANQDGNILADPTQIGQILVNLAVNGRDAMAPGGKLTIETGSAILDQDYAADDPEIKPGHWMVLSVSDTGSGISPEAQKHLFEPFFTTKAVGRGTGLGLATIYGIVKQSGGFIKVYSEVGTGTTFKIYFPQVFNEATATGPTDELCPRGAETILLVEDEAMVRSTLKRFLTKQGYQIIEAVNGEDGVARFRENAAIIDMLFTDVVMPNKNGWQLYEQLRALRPDLRVLFMSGYTEHQGILHAGVNFISKPCHLAELARRIREILDAPVSTPVISPSGEPEQGASGTRRYS
ncbi:MAG TPA: response regulator, partial [Opitutaceae bacterium]|nr:response regulator [Opitutaceae bacterium]